MLNRIRGYRVMIGLTQEEMAGKLGVTKQAYSLKELGKSPFKDHERLIIRELVREIKPDITIDELFYS